MASLRRKPAETIVTSPAVAGVSEVQIPSAPAPSSALSSDQEIEPQVVTPPPPQLDPATSSLKQQLQALKDAEIAQHQAALAAQTEQRRQSWLSSNQLAQQNFASLSDLHEHALKAGNVDCSPSYFDFMNAELARLQTATPHRIEQMRERIAESDQPEPPQPVPQPASSFGRNVSAPVSRDVSYGGNSQRRITLTAQQAEIARMAGISESEYAKQLMRLNEMKANGDYAERR